MSRVDGYAAMPPSVLDRLLDDHPDRPLLEVTSYLGLIEFKAAIARDLEVLLNTRAMFVDDWGGEYPLAAQSILNFGIPDLSGLSLLNPDHHEVLCENVRRAIECHEPRLSRVRVAVDLSHGAKRLLHFRVDAMLKVHSGRPPVSFDVTLELSSNAYEVRG